MYSTVYKSISKILLSYDYVVIPELGGFVSQYQSAVIDAENQTIHPPFKRISFNTHLKDNDGLLMQTLINDEGLSSEEAKHLIQSFVKAVFKDLNEGKTFTIEHLGVLFFNSQMKIEFNFFDEENYNPYAYGLTSVNCTPFEKPKAQRQRLSFKMVGKVAMWLPLVLLGAVLSFYLNQNQFTENHQTASFSDYFNQSEKSNTTATTPVEMEHSQDITPTLEPSTKILKESSVAHTELPKQASNIEESKKVSPTQVMQFALVAGSFKSKKNAESFLSKLHLEGKVKAFNNIYRVFIKECVTKKEAITFKQNYKKQKIDTWILKLNNAI